MSNLPDDVSPEYIDKNYGGKEEMYRVDVPVFVTLTSIETGEGVNAIKDIVASEIDKYLDFEYMIDASTYDIVERTEEFTCVGVTLIIDVVTVNKSERKQLAIEKVSSSVKNSDTIELQ